MERLKPQAFDAHRYEEPPHRVGKPRVKARPCRFCPAQVDEEVVAAARHLLYACPRATADAKDAASKVLADVRAKEEAAVVEQARGGGVAEEQIPDILRKLRAQDYELAGPPPELRHDRTNGISSRVIERMATRLERVK